MQDGAPMHWEANTINFLVENGITTMRWPAQSPDLNCIELVWGSLKRYVREVEKPKDTDEMIACIREWWGRVMTKKQCELYVRHVADILPKVVHAERGNVFGWLQVSSCLDTPCLFRHNANMFYVFLRINVWWLGPKLVTLVLCVFYSLT